MALTHDHLDAKSMMDRVRSPKAGAIVLFAGDIVIPLINKYSNASQALLEIILVANQ